ncbi:hypothetical protein BVRB_8g200730 [Beta vulgaris subsp. vulgaris]|uniref:Peptidase M1 membrane alanine aminopeptidase domain-containing protein n=1 Tax=Beta vulgaris subsp. vulgaris TaxID=3555 RepID=A0A0J8B6R9_BETVV|nr:hypothetical protein BVRB_8g200730 [Beta vulgaris subsp. vulgaris]
MVSSNTKASGKCGYGSKKRIYRVYHGFRKSLGETPKTATDADYAAILCVIGHEYFHNWNGNRVTCRDWFQLSLNEGLTVFRDQEFSSDMGSRTV